MYKEILKVKAVYAVWMTLILLPLPSAMPVRADSGFFMGSAPYIPPAAFNHSRLEAITTNAQGSGPCFLIDFEGVGDLQPIGSVSGAVEIGFGSSWLGIVDIDAGGTGNFANETSPSTIAFFLDQGDISIDLSSNIQQVTLFYSAAANSIPVVISAFDQNNNLVDRVTGSVVGTDYDGAACAGDPNGEFCLWTPLVLVSTTTDIRRIEISGTESNYFGIDDMEVCVNSPLFIFADGFESGNTSQWANGQ